MVKRIAVYFMVGLLVSMTLFSGEALALEAKVISYRGDIKIVPAGGEKVKCQSGMAIASGTFLETGTGAFLTLGLGEESLVNLREKSKVIVKLSENGGIELVDGKVFALLKGLDKKNPFVIKTPSAVCGARGTGWETETNDKETRISVFDGKVFMKGINLDGSVMDKEFITSRGYGRSVKRNESPGKKEKLLKDKMGSLDREAAFAGNAVGLIRAKDSAKKHAKKEEQRVNTLSNRLEKDDPSSRLERMIAPGTAPVIPGRGGDDDDKKRNKGN